MQLHGVAMGTKLAPSLATLFLSIIEDRYISNAHIKPSLWRRYIDDVFFVWQDSHETLDTFIAGLNILKPRLKFTANISSFSVNFLDLIICKGPDFVTSGLLDTEISYKDTNHFSYIHGTSFHPKHTFKAIGKGEAIRILRACSSLQDFSKHMSHLIKKFRTLHFPRSAILATKYVTFNVRTKYLSPYPKPSSKKIFFLTKYCYHKPTLHLIFLRHWLAMESDHTIDTYFLLLPL